MSAANERRRPVQEAASMKLVEQEPGSSLTIIPPPVEASQPLGGHPVFLTVAEVRDDRVTRRVFLTLAPAQRVVEAARARGAEAHLYVLEAHPSAEITVEDGAVAR